MDNIKNSFLRVKKDMTSLKERVTSLEENLSKTRKGLIEMCEILKEIDKKTEDFIKNSQKNFSTQNPQNFVLSTHPSTHPSPLEGLKPQNLMISTGNEGVPTDRQTDKQTDRQTNNLSEFKKNDIESAVEILNSLDAIRKEVRLKFKRLTDQEFLVFSAIYQLDEEVGHSDYKTLSQQLNLSESSVRDYVGRIIKKGIPVDKKKINNKQIYLSVSNNLKKIATLRTIFQLRDL
ncbi:MAG: helix-turn-helix domain-containing protein [Nanoarchaeota archaeon]|nr:helix-turn-helix domain-containing protein [Nanoarchaeota archaeon]